MRRATVFQTATLLFATLMLAAACGSSEDSSVVADEGSSVTVVGADSAIVEEGDDRPVEEGDAASVVSVMVDLPDGADVAGVAIIALEDVSFADSDALEIARIEVPVSQLLEQGNKVEIFLPLPLDGSVDITATAHIDVDESGSVSQGDWISPDLAMVTPESAADVTVTMIQV